MRNGEPAFALRLRRRAGRPRSQGGDAWLGKVMWEVVRSKIFAGTVREYFDPEAMDGVVLASLEDIGAMKLSAVSNRGAKKDFIDIAALLEEGSLGDLLAAHGRKFPQTDLFTVVKSIAWFKDADAEPEPEPEPKLLQGQSWESVKSAIATGRSGEEPRIGNFWHLVCGSSDGGQRICSLGDPGGIGSTSEVAHLGPGRVPLTPLFGVAIGPLRPEGGNHGAQGFVRGLSAQELLHVMALGGKKAGKELAIGREAEALAACAEGLGDGGDDADLGAAVGEAEALGDFAGFGGIEGFERELGLNGFEDVGHGDDVFHVPAVGFADIHVFDTP